jgi:uncharacterized membrane protein YkvA (DUF1232 family)
MGFWQQAAGWPSFSWQDFTALKRQAQTEDSGLRGKFWRKLLREAANVPFLEDVLTAHYCVFDRQTPVHVKAVLAGAIVYFVVPDDLIPDYIPVIGYADDAAVLGAAFKLVSSHIKPEHREAAQRMLVRLRQERS